MTIGASRTAVRDPGLAPGRVDGKVAFITGAARGQGRSHAVRLAQEGADVIAVDIAEAIPGMEAFYPAATAEDLRETALLVEQLGRRVVTVKADVRDAAALSDAAELGMEFGRIDIVAANAGIFVHGSATHDTSESVWSDDQDINVTGAWLTVKATVPYLIAGGRGGAIVITSSTAGLKGTRNVGAYTTSKHALVGLMRTLALELAEHRIRVNTIHPTGVDADMIINDSTFRLFLPDESHPTREQASIVFAQLQALPIPWIESIDVSNALLWLASDEARYVTGVALPVDGGASCL